MPSSELLVWIVAAAFVATLAAFAFSEGRRYLTAARLANARTASDELRDEVWRLESAAAARDRAEAANEAKGRFLATVSHEIRTPLAGIIGAADLLASLELGGEAGSYVGAIKASGAALASLIDEILDFSRIEAGHLELADVRFDLRPLIEGVVELLGPRAHGKGLSIAALVSPDVPASLRGDPARLRQVLLNLTGNAVKFTECGGLGLRVDVAPEGEIRFSVADTGCGVPTGRRHAIFEEFEQADQTSTRAHGGAGLGLAISRALAHRMGGALTLERSGPDGSVFVLTLPGGSTPASPALPVRPGEGLRALLVGDAPFETAYLAERLTTLGATVTAATSEDMAREMLAAGPAYDVAIIDGATGEEIARRLAALAKASGVGRSLILVSPFERRALTSAAWRAFDGWLVKPVREDSLRACLRPVLAGAKPAGGSARPPRLDGLHVLVAEDDDVNALIAVRLLERQGARVTRVRDGAAALVAAAAPPVDIVLMDIRMPILDGLAAARALRLRSGPRLPLVALSANAFAEDRESALRAGFDLFLTKPVGLDVLASAIARAVRGRDTQVDAA